MPATITYLTPDDLAQVVGELSLLKDRVTKLESGVVPPPPPPAVTVSIVPESASIKTGESVQFQAATNRAKGVSWTSSFGKSITQDGLYTAGQSAGVATVTATSIDDPSKSASATVTITAPVVPPPPPPPQVEGYIVTPHDKIPDFGGKPTVVSTKDGNWSDSLSKPPVDGDVVLITHNVLLDAAVAARLKAIGIKGKLAIKPDASTKLVTQHAIVYASGELTGTVDKTFQLTFSDVPLDTSDPDQYGNGLIVLGKLTMRGQAKPNTFIRLSKSPVKGDTTLSLAVPAIGWNVGDKLVLPDTHQLDYWEQAPYSNSYVPQWELPTIAGVSADGKTITLKDPLTFDHLGNDPFLCHVANLTRNVVIKSENSNGVRGYCLFTHRAEIDIRYVQFAGLGRTTKDPISDTNKGDRYPITFRHLWGPAKPTSEYQYRFEGNSVLCLMNPFTFRWGIDIKDCHYGLITNNVVYNWASSGISVEGGNETGNVFSGNYVSRIFGNGDRNNDGLDGTGYWFKGPNNIIRNNIASNIRGTQAYCYGFNISPKFLGTVNTPKFPGADMGNPNEVVPVDMNAVTLPDFTNNEVYGATYGGLELWWLGTRDSMPLATAGVVKDFKVWNVCLYGYFGYETNGLTIDGWVQRGDTSNATVYPDNWAQIGIFFNDYAQRNLVIKNADIRGVQVGIEAPVFSHGEWVLKDSYLKNIVNVNIPTVWSVSGGEVVPARKTTISNVKFDRYPGNSHATACDILMNYSARGSTNVVQSDSVFVTNYNGVSGDNFRLYYTQQKADFIVPQTGSNTDGGHVVVGSPDAGLTNQQNWDKHKLCIAGEIAPAGSTTRANIVGLVHA